MSREGERERVRSRAPEMSNGEKVCALEREVKRKRCQEEDVQTSDQQPESLSGFKTFKDVKDKPVQEKVTSSNKDGERKKCQAERVPRDHAVNSRDNQGLRLRSYKCALYRL